VQRVTSKFYQNAIAGRVQRNNQENARIRIQRGQGKTEVVVVNLLISVNCKLFCLILIISLKYLVEDGEGYHHQLDSSTVTWNDKHS